MSTGYEILGKIKYFVTDLDGTVRLDYTPISIEGGRVKKIPSTANPELLEGVQKMKRRGIHFGVASGQGRREIHSFFKEEAELFVAENGGIVEDQNRVYYPGEIYGVNVSQKKHERDIIAKNHESQKYGVTPFKLETDIKLLYLHKRGDLKKFEKQCKENVVAGWRAKVYGGGEEMHVDYDPDYVQKADGIKFLLEKLGISPSVVAYFGDSSNDRSVFEWDGIRLKIAPKNAKDDIKGMADWIVDCPPDGAIQLVNLFLKYN